MPLLATEGQIVFATEDSLVVLATEDTLTSGCYFYPPTELVVPPILPDDPPLARRLFQNYHMRPRGRTVWHLVDDSFTFDQPWPLYDNSAQTIAAEGSNNNIAATYKTVYYGGHLYTVSDAECALISTFLTGQGYTSSDWILHATDGLP